MGRKPSLEQKWREQADAFRREAEKLPYGKEREQLLRLARRLETASHIKRMGIVAGIVATEVRQWQTTEPTLLGTTDISATVKRAPAMRIATQSIGPESWPLTSRSSFGAASVSWRGSSPSRNDLRESRWLCWSTPGRVEEIHAQLWRIARREPEGMFEIAAPSLRGAKFSQRDRRSPCTTTSPAPPPPLAPPHPWTKAQRDQAAE